MGSQSRFFDIDQEIRAKKHICYIYKNYTDSHQDAGLRAGMAKQESRNSLFRELFSEAAEKQLTESADSTLRVCVRPPFALPEADFLLACTRCAACLHACSYHVLHLLPVRCGFLRSGTPAMELTRAACHLCAHWPCVAACETGALVFPAVDKMPVLGRMAVSPELCLNSRSNECSECYDSCPVEGAISWQENGTPKIDSRRCPGCAMCLQACVAEPRAIDVQYVV